MIIINLSDCPPKIRGDLSKWLFEINTGIYVGNLSARVRDALWDRIKENIGSGRATMVYTTNTEQGFDFEVYGSTWEPVDYDGLKIMRMPSLKRIEHQRSLTEKIDKKSRIEKTEIAQAMSNKRAFVGKKYVVIDLETTGINIERDRIIEIGAIKVDSAKVINQYNVLIKQETGIPDEITKLTGLNNQILNDKGIPLKEALQGLAEFTAGEMVIGYNIIQFDSKILRYECKRTDFQFMLTNVKDILLTAKRKVTGIEDYKMCTVARKLGIEVKQEHRAIQDCLIAMEIFEKIG